MFVREDGEGLDPVWVSRRFHQLVRWRLSPASAYTFAIRRATATLGAGVPLKVVSERLGHSSVSITTNSAHVSEGIDRQAADTVAS